MHISEAAALTGSPDKSGRMRVQAISAGVGSSGYYSPDVLREAATNRLIDAGTHLYFDHPSETETTDRPERSVRDIAATFTAPAVYDEASEALVGEIQVLSPYRDLLAEMAPHIGLSIRGSATDVTEGEHDGRRVPVIEGLAAIDSVDFVTKAGRGGKVLQILESVREAKYSAEQLRDLLKAGHAIKNNDGDPAFPIDDVADLKNAIRAVGRTDMDHAKVRRYIMRRAKAMDETDLIPDDWNSDGTLSEVAEASTSDVRDALDSAVKDAYSTDKDTWVYVRDFDPDKGLVWFQTSGPTAADALWQQPYTANDPGVTLDGVPVRVAAQTRYVPVTPAGHPTTESKEVPMKEIEEARLAQLEEAAGRVSALEAERDQAVQDRDAARAELAERDRADKARRIIDAADAEFTALEARGLMADLPLTEKGDLDESAFTEAVKTAAADKAKASEAVRGFGHTPRQSVTEADIDKQLADIFGGEGA